MSGVVAQGFCDVFVVVESKQADRDVAQSGHDLGAGADADLAVVFGVGDVSIPVKKVLTKQVRACF